MDASQQVRKLWEVLLYGQTGWEEAQREAVVEGLVRARLVGSVTSTKRVAEGKRIFDLPGGGFCMTKVCCRHGCSDRAFLDSTSHVSDCCKYSPLCRPGSALIHFFSMQKSRSSLCMAVHNRSAFFMSGLYFAHSAWMAAACFPCK